MTNKENQELEIHFKVSLEQYKVPTHIHNGLIRYLVNHIKPGDFLSTFLENDLKNAIFTADDENLVHFIEIMRFLHNEASPHSYGSKEKVINWLQTKDLHSNCDEDSNG